MVAPTVLRPADIEQGERRELPVPEPSRQRPPVNEIDVLVGQALGALDAYAALDQDKIDYIVKKASVAALDQHGQLAQAAVAETGRGVFEDKAVKNIFACEHVTHCMDGLRTVGVISSDEINGIIEIAEPVGVVCRHHPGHQPDVDHHLQEPDGAEDPQPDRLRLPPGRPAVLGAAARVVRDAAIAAGAPENCIQWIEQPVDRGHRRADEPPRRRHSSWPPAATRMVKAAYSCGKPALGVGAGNVPAFIERTAKLRAGRQRRRACPSRSTTA